MLISHSKKFIFVHIPKTAGTSAKKIFSPYARLRDRIAYDFRITQPAVRFVNKNLRLHNDGNKWLTGYHKHSKISEIKIDNPNDYFKFAFVRNPYDWMTSLFFYIKGAQNHRDNIATQSMGFEEFIKFKINEKIPRQSDYICDQEGRIDVDFIGKFESLTKDIAFLCKKLNIPGQEIPRQNVSWQRK